MNIFEKYKPNNCNEIIGNEYKVKEIDNWFDNINKSSEKILFISGLPGIGKSAIFSLYAKKYDYCIQEFSYSSFKDSKKLKSTINNILNFKNIVSLLGNKNKKLLLFDNIHLVTSKNERTIFSDLIKTFSILLKKNKLIYPIVFIGTFMKEKKFTLIKKSMKVINLSKIKYNLLYDFINKICIKENISINDDKKLSIINKSNSSLFYILSTLNIVSYTEDNNIDCIQDNYIEYTVNEIVKNSFNNKIEWDKLSSLYLSEPFLITLLLIENYPDFINNINYKDKKDIYLNLSDNFTLYDYLSTSVINEQHWDLMPYLSYLTIIMINYFCYKNKKYDIKTSSIRYSKFLNKTSNKNIKLKKKNTLNLTNLSNDEYADLEILKSVIKKINK